MKSNTIIKRPNYKPYPSRDKYHEKIYVDTQGKNYFEPKKWEPSCELLEMENYYLLKMEIVGIKKEALNIKYLNNWIVISGERIMQVVNKKGAVIKDGEIVFSEFVYGKFKREIPLPNDVDGSRMKAKYQDGILGIIIPKKDPFGFVDIEIN